MTNPADIGQRSGFQDELSPEEAWVVVLARDSSFDGEFVYAVSSTGIYCRPACPARRPHRRNVSFFPDPTAAEAAGYRPCRRCRPNRDEPSAAVRSVSRAREYLDEHLDENVTLERLGRAVHTSPYHLQRTFKDVIGVSPRQYVEAKRAERLKESLKKGDTVSRATYEAGYSSSSRVYEQADAHLGMTPATYGRGGKGVRIRFSSGPSVIGRVLVGATERGVCSVAFGEDDRALEAELREEFSAAIIERDDTTLRDWVVAIARYVEGARSGLTVPVDLQGTHFQMRVWKALRQIPYGETRSYGEIAAAIDNPSAARAVARACATNKAALVVPCHRVVRGDGALGGYRWKIERKRRLLEQEQRS